MKDQILTKEQKEAQKPNEEIPEKKKNYDWKKQHQQFIENLRFNRKIKKVKRLN